MSEVLKVALSVYHVRNSRDSFGNFYPDYLCLQEMIQGLSRKNEAILKATLSDEKPPLAPQGSVRSRAAVPQQCGDE